MDVDLMMPDWYRPGDFQYNEHAVLCQTKNGYELITSTPLIPTAEMENLDSGTTKIELTYIKYGKIRKVVVDKETISNKNKIISLSNYGLDITSANAGAVVKYLATCLAINAEDIPHPSAKSTLGWVGDDFVPYADTVTFDSEDGFKALYDAVSPSGNLWNWIEYVGALREVLPMRLTLAASFASPLISKVGQNPFVFHLWGGTGSGKTVGAMVAASVWGNPESGKLVRTMNMTPNSMMATAAFLNHLPFFGDELQTIRTSYWQNYDSLIMSITEGINRGRMKFDKVNETKSWKCAFIFTGEEPCVKRDSGGGAKNRVVEVECTDKIVVDGHRTANFVRDNYGTAGPEYITAIINSDVKEMYRTYFSDILQNADTTDKQAGSAALLLVADEIARRTFWPSERPLTFSDIVPYLSLEKEVDQAERAYEYVCDTIAEHPDNFSDNGREAWGVIENGFWYINKKSLERMLGECKSDFKAVSNKWIDKGYMIEHGTAEPRWRWHKVVRGQKNVCCVKLRMPSGDDDAEVLPF